jgi:micrococcal nuclease
MRRFFEAGLLVAALGSPAAFGATALSGTVTQVLDGQTVMVTPAAGGAPVRVRVQGIVAPGPCLAGGPEARQALKELVDQLAVRVEGGVADRSGRITGTLLQGTTDVGGQLVENGFAWSVRTKWDRGPYVKQERVAKALARGLHTMSGVNAPRPGQPLPVCP